MSAYYHTCVLILLHMSPLTTLYVSSYYYICVLILLYVCPHPTLYMCPHTPTYAPVDYSPFSRNDPMARGCPEGLACRGGRGGQENRDDMFACGKRGDSSPELIMSNRCLYMRVVLQTYRRATYVASCSCILVANGATRLQSS
jgi:hypothetical protein